MKRISLIAVIVLFASVSGLAQKDTVRRNSNSSSVSYVTTGVTEHRRNNVTNMHIDHLLRQLSAEEEEGITAITVTKSLLDVMPEIHSYVEENGVNIKKVIAKLEHLDVFISENPMGAVKLKNINKEIVSSPFSTVFPIEVLLKFKNEQENFIFYGEKSPDSGNFVSFIMFSENRDMEEKLRGVLIRLTGTFSKNEIEQIIRLKRGTKK
jgi:hypothetical protein